MDPTEPYRQVMLDWIQVYASQNMSGIHKLDLKFHQPLFLDMADTLVAQLHAYVMGEPAGATITETVNVYRHRRPKWIPKRLWAKVPRETAMAKLEVAPKWCYPQATVRVPDLGIARPILFQTYTPVRWEDGAE
jgi:hypothetical protein